MPYDDTIKQEAVYVANLATVTEDNLYALYRGILTTWFPTSRGYVLDHQVLGRTDKPAEYVVVRHAGGDRNPLLVVELGSPDKWNDAGRRDVLQDLVECVEGQFDLTRYNAIYGVGGIGFHWMVCKMEKSGPPHAATTVLDWDDDISSDRSYDAFEAIAKLVYEID